MDGIVIYGNRLSSGAADSVDFYNPLMSVVPSESGITDARAGASS